MRAVLVLCLLLVSGCGGDHGLAAHRATWRERGLTSYTFVFTAFGMAGTQSVRVTVRDGKAVSAEPGPGTQHDAFEPARPTVDEVFALLAKDLDEADEVTISWDATYGVPTHVRVDQDKHAIDDEHGYGVSDVQRA